jgi:hypothetical protein
MPTNRFSAAFFHLLGGGIIISVIACVIFFIWYPGLLAYASGVGSIFLILAFVDLLLGPFITLIVFDLRKKELKRDLLFLVLIQIVALAYGVWVLFSARPVFIVFNADRFDVVYANEFPREKIELLKNTEFSALPVLGPSIIGARLPPDSQKANEIIKNAIAGEDDVQYMPELYVSYQSIGVDAGKQAKELAELYRLNKSAKQQVDELIDRFSSLSDKIGYIPLKGRLNDLVVVVDRTDGQLLEFNKLKPFSYTYGTDLVDIKKILNKN